MAGGTLLGYPKAQRGIEEFCQPSIPQIMRRSVMNISMKMRLLRFLGGAIMMVAAIPDAHATPAPIIGCSSLTEFTSPTIPKVVITSAVLTAATQSLPEHCLVNGKI